MQNTSLAQTIREYLQNNGVLPFWVESAMNWIERALAGNRHFATDVRYPRLTVKDGYVSSFTCHATASIPDENRTINGKLSYSFNPTAKKAHKVNFAA